MATAKVCDKCGGEAVCDVEVKGSNLTTVKKDLCENCFLKFKEIARWLTGQEITQYDV